MGQQSQRKNPLLKLTRMRFSIFHIVIQASSIALIWAQQDDNNAGCITTCCMGCSRFDNCDSCYKLTDPDSCPCVDDLSESSLAKLNSRLGTRYRSNSINLKSDSQRIWTQEDLWEDIEDVVDGDCKPLCCPSFKCTPELCPICFRRNRTDRKTCPCVQF